MSQALQDLCEEAIRRGTSILIDAEQQFVQPGIDKVALDLMHKYNRGQRVVVYNTYQAYLKATQHELVRHLRQAQEQDFAIGIKLVRGAYIRSEPRYLIQNSKEETDATYDSIVRHILQRKYPWPHHQTVGFPRLSVFLATHNKASVLKAFELQQELAKSGQSLVKVQFAQLFGMADEVSCTLLQMKLDQGAQAVPLETYKCLSWGTVNECISYLSRRAMENRDGVAGTQEERAALKREALRRLWGRLSH